MTIHLTLDEISKIIRALGDDPLAKKLKRKTNRVKGPKADLSCLAENWPSDIVYRRDMNKFTGGVIDFKTMQNYDSQGKGPDRIKIGKRTAYRIEPLIKWIEDRSEVLS